MEHAVSQGRRDGGIIAGIRNFFSAAADMIERRRTFERVYGELSSLSDRELSDIGISRSQIVDIAWEASGVGRPLGR